MELRVPSSLLPVRHVAPLAVLVVALCILVESFRSAGEDGLFVLFLFGIPVVALAAALFYEGRRSARGFWRSLLVGVGMEVMLAVLLTVLAPAESLALAAIAAIGAVMCFGVVFVVMLPIVIAGCAYSTRKDLEAGDAMLLVGGAWLFIIQAFTLAVVPREAPWVLPGLAAGVLAIGVSVARMRARRAWCRKATRGELHGVRVRMPSSLTELESLPPVYGSAHDVFAVVERLVAGRTAYRSAVVGEPLFSIRLRGEVHPELLPGAPFTP
jgi:hypothetical protein